MEKIQSYADVLSEYFHFSGLVVIDVGCGTGDLVRWMTSKGAIVTGVDLSELIDKAETFQRVGAERYQVGTAQELPFENGYADLIVYLASFHHIPEPEMQNAIDKCYDILKPNGHVVFIEPIAQTDSYYELTRLIDDEADIQKKAYGFIQTAGETKFQQLKESLHYLERSFQDYLSLINIYVPDENQREQIIQQAKKLINQRNETLEKVRFRSLGRLNILQKKNHST